jgi:hypothetical protein
MNKPRGNARAPTTRKRTKTVAKSTDPTVERRALELRLAGRTYDELADELECAPSMARTIVDRALTRSGTRNEKAEQLRTIEVARCDAIIASFWERATDKSRSTTQVTPGGADGIDVDKYDPSQDRAAITLLKAMERRASLLGLDAEKRSGVNISIVQHPDFAGITRVVFEALTPFPDARAAVIARMKSAISAQRTEAFLTGGTT